MDLQSGQRLNYDDRSWSKILQLAIEGFVIEWTSSQAFSFLYTSRTRYDGYSIWYRRLECWMVDYQWLKGVLDIEYWFWLSIFDVELLTNDGLVLAIMTECCVIFATRMNCGRRHSVLYIWSLHYQLNDNSYPDTKIFATVEDYLSSF